MLPLLLMLATAVAGNAQAQPVARVGIEVPMMGITFWQAHHDWRWSLANYFSPEAMADIKNQLHADYIRTGFIPDWVNAEHPRWRREDRVMDDACGAGLDVLVIVPTGYDHLGLDDLRETVQAFFTRYIAREPGCGLLAEIGNEENLATKPSAYAAVFEALAPAIAATGVPVVTAGTSGLDTRWAHDVATLLDAWCPVALRTGGRCALPQAFGFHPYGIAPARIQDDVTTLAASTGRDPSRIYVTEYGNDAAETLSAAIFALAAQPVATVYEYRCQPTDDDCRYGLKDHPALYDAVAGAFGSIAARRPANAPSPFRRASAARR